MVLAKILPDCEFISFCLPFIIFKRLLKNRHWLEFTEYASIAGVATGAIASFLAKQILYLSTPLSIALLVGLANRRRVERLNEEKTSTSIATLKRKLSQQIKLMDQHIQTLPTPEMVGDVRNSTLRHSRDELKQLTTKIHAIQAEMGQYASIFDEQNSGGMRDELRQLQGFYTEIYTSLKQLQQTFDTLDIENKNKNVESLVTEVRAESEQIQSRFKSLSDKTQPILSYLQEQVNHLNRQNNAILQQVDANSLKRELDILMDAVADLAPKRELNTVMADIRTLQENQDAQGQSEDALRKQLQSVMQKLQAVPDVPQFRAQIEETLSWKLNDINKQLRSLPNTDQFQAQIKATLQTELDRVNHQLENRSDSPPYKLLFDLHSHLLPSSKSTLPVSDSQHILHDALSSAKQRLIMVWPWSVDRQMDKPLMQNLERFVKQGRQLDIGWCHITSSQEERFLSVINRRWSLEPLHRRSLQRTLQYFLALKRRYPKNFKFRVLGAVENFLVVDQSFAVLGIEDRFTPISAVKDISLKLWTSDKTVIQQLVQTFDDTDLAPEDIESHWNRAITRYDLGDRAGAMVDINQALAINPNYAAAYNMRGIIRMDQGKQEAALADFGQALALDDTQITAYCNRGFIHSEQGDQYRAIADFSLAIQTESNTRSDQSPNPTLGISYFYRGLACQKLDDFAGAIADYSEALKHVESSPVIRYHRGITYQAIGHYTHAIDDLEQAVALFEQKGSQANTRRASRHLAQARKALAVGTTMPSVLASSPAATRDIPRVASVDERQPPPVLPEAEESLAMPSQDESAAVDSQSEAETSTVAPSRNATTPAFWFPDVSRSRPSMIQDMDAGSEVKTEKMAQPEQSPLMPTNAQAAPLSKSSGDENHTVPPRPRHRRRKADLDKLVTSTLTNFFDEVDMDKVGTQTLDNFFGVVQNSPIVASSPNPELSAPSSSQTVEANANALPQGIEDVGEGGAESLFDGSDSSQNNHNHDEAHHARQPQETDRADADIEKLVTSTLTTFFNDLNPDDPNGPPANFFEEVSRQDIGEQTLVDFHRVIDDRPSFTNNETSAANATPPAQEKPNIVFPEERGAVSDSLHETREADIRVTDEQTSGEEKGLSLFETTSQPPLSMDHFFDETTSEAVGDGTLINFQFVVQDPPTETSQLVSERATEQLSSHESERGMAQLSKNENKVSMTSPANDSLNAINTEESDAQTLENFMETIQDVFVPEKSGLEEDDNTRSAVESLHENPFQIPQTGDLSVRPVNEQLFQSPSGSFVESALNGNAPQDPPPLDNDSPFSDQGPYPHADNTIVDPFKIEPNGLPVGTETMSNLMTAIAEEELGAQTLRAFVEIMGEEKARADYPNTAIAPAMNGSDHRNLEALNGAVHPVEDQPPEQGENREDVLSPAPLDPVTQAAIADPSAFVVRDNTEDAKTEDDSMFFESLADFSNLF